MIGRLSAPTSGYGEERALSELVVAASSLLDPSALAEVTIEQVRRLLGVDGAVLVLHDREDGVLVPLALRGQVLSLSWRIFHPGQGAIGTAFSTGRPMLSSDSNSDLPWPVGHPAPESIAAVPISAESGVVGVIAGLSTVGHTLTERDLELLDLVAAQVGPALVTMRTLAREQRRTAEATALATLMRQGAESSGLDERIVCVTDFAQRLVGADLAGVVLRDPGAEATAWRGIIGNRTEEWRERIYPEGHPAGATIWGDRLRVVRGVEGGALDEHEFPFFGAEGVLVGISIPLASRRHSVGALCLGWRSPVELAAQLLDTVVALARFAGTLVAGAAAEVQRGVLIDTAPVALIAFDLAGTVTVLEGRGAAQLGFGPADVGRSLDDIFADDPIHASRLHYALRTGDAGPPMTVEYRERVFDVQTLLLPLGAFLVATDVTERHAAERELARRAAYDELTGLPNGLEARRRASDALRSAPLVAAMADVRAFDHVNETFGYETGDQLLRTLGLRLAEDVPDALVVGRSGGDEFLVFAVPTDTDDEGRDLGERVAASLAAPVEVRGTAIYVACSCGVAREAAGGDAIGLMRHADVALQMSRRRDGRLTVHDASIARDLTRQLLLTAELVAALADGHVALAYQPIVDIHTERLHSVEALARWTSQTVGPVPAPELVGLAERSGRMPQLTEYVLDRALRDVAGIGVPVCVNVSPSQVHGTALTRCIDGLLARHGLPPSHLCIELTETAALESDAAATQELAAIRARGVTIAVDDFGQGWSSLELLKRLPADLVKLDRAFVAELASDERDKAIVRGAVDIAAAHGMAVVAEGIEDHATLAVARSLGCGFAQGFHLGRPMPIDDLARWVDMRRGV
jgi:diguanylate cyclase (GGDEF)-like protein